MENVDQMISGNWDNITANIISNVLNLPLYINITLINMLLTSVTIQRYSPVTTPYFEDEYDFIVVGAGSAGSVVASRLSELPCISVLLLEAGPSPPVGTDIPAVSGLYQTTDLNWHYSTVPQKRSAKGHKNRVSNYAMGKVLGGCSTINDMVYVRGNAKNFDDWARSGALGWSYDEVLPYFKKMEQNFNPEHVDKGFHGFEGPISVMRAPYSSPITNAILRAARELGYPIVDYNGRQQTGFFNPQFTMRNGQRSGTAKGYLAEADSRSNLHILKEAFVRKIIIRNHRAVGVEFDYLGKLRRVYAKREVIVSAGTFSTPKLLMLSGIGPSEELNKFQIPIHADLPVGLNFHDHAIAVMTYGVDEISTAQQLQNECELEEYVTRRTGHYASLPTVGNGFLTNNGNFSADAVPDNQIIFVKAPGAAIRNFNVDGEVYEKVFAPHANETTLFCYAFVIKPRSRGTIKLRSLDPYAKPVIDPNFYADRQDVRDVVQALKHCNILADTEPMKRIGVRRWQEKYPYCTKFIEDSDRYLECQAKLVTVAGHHPAGSVKMGDPRDLETVVDPELRVKGIKGLRVVDASIMPQVTTGNTNAPTIMIGEKAADIIKQTICCTSCPGIEECDV